MTVIKTNILNAFFLILMGLWGYLEVTSPTALIPVVFGIIIGVLTFIAQKNQKIEKSILLIAGMFTLLILFALVGMRLPKSLESGGIGLLRVIIMISSSTTALLGLGQYLFYKKN